MVPAENFQTEFLGYEQFKMKELEITAQFSDTRLLYGFCWLLLNTYYQRQIVQLLYIWLETQLFQNTTLLSWIVWAPWILTRIMKVLFSQFRASGANCVFLSNLYETCWFLLIMTNQLYLHIRLKFFGFISIAWICVSSYLMIKLKSWSSGLLLCYNIIITLSATF